MGSTRSLLVASVMIGAVAVATPSLFKSYMPSGDVAAEVTRAGEAEASGGEEAQAAPAARQHVEIDASGDGHFYVDADVNSRRVRLMVDTGATVVALRQSDAEAAGIRLRKADFTNPVQTANGTTMAAEAMIDSIAVEEVEVRNIRALVIPDDQLSISLLGGSFLNGLERFEIAGGTLIFEN